MSTQQQVLDAVRRLPLGQQQRLAEQIIQQTTKSRSIMLVAIKRLPQEKQHRLDALADKNADGQLTAEERSELNHLVAVAQQLALENAQALVRAQRPELFDVSGRPVRRRVQEAVRSKARSERVIRTKNK
jgi:hypothetical protein